MKMAKETLRRHLHNKLLLDAIKQKQEINNLYERIKTATATARDIGVSTETLTEFRDKLMEYGKIRQGYDRLIGQAWGISPDEEIVIKRFMGCTDEDLDSYGDYIEFLGGEVATMNLQTTPTGYKFTGCKADLKSHIAANQGQTVKAFILNRDSPLSAPDAEGFSDYISERHGELYGK